jgi:hypothetical protein
MTRRVIKVASEVEAFRETRPTVRRRFQAGTVLNVLQWVTPDVARFTVEGEGIELWCCPQAVFDEQTESPERST